MRQTETHVWKCSRLIQHANWPTIVDRLGGVQMKRFLVGALFVAFIAAPVNAQSAWVGSGSLKTCSDQSGTATPSQNLETRRKFKATIR
jgi:hypothetical protein